METIIKSTKDALHLETKSVSAIWKSIEFNRFGIIAILVVVLGCLGGLAASFGAADNLLKLSMVAFPTIISLALVLAVAPMRVIVYASAIALILDVLVIIF